jgi:hypothetical protein
MLHIARRTQRVDPRLLPLSWGEREGIGSLPSPRGEGGPRPAFSPAGAGRVRGQLHGEVGQVGQHNQVTPHLAPSARHPLPKGEGCVSGFGPRCVRPKTWIMTREVEGAFLAAVAGGGRPRYRAAHCPLPAAFCPLRALRPGCSAPSVSSPSKASVIRPLTFCLLAVSS